MTATIQARTTSGIELEVEAIRQLLKRQPQRQEVFEFMKEHAIIRDISEYAQFVRQALYGEDKS